MITLVEYKNFCTKEVCTEIINLGISNLQRAEVNADDSRISDSRTAYLTTIKRNTEIAKEFIKAISTFSGIPESHIECPQLIQYKTGGEYKPHHDFPSYQVRLKHPKSYEAYINSGGHRLATALLYLNDDFTGGETEFPLCNIKVAPETGKLIIWKNVTGEQDNLSLDYDTLHAGLPVISGTKYILATWIREKEYVKK